MGNNSLSLYRIEEDLLALLDSEDTAGEDQRLEILDAIAEAHTGAVAKRDNVARFLIMLEHRLESVDDEIDRLKALKQRWENEQKRFRAYIVSVIERFAPEPKRGPKKLEGNTSVLSLAANPSSVDITDSHAIPLEYKNVTIQLSGIKYALLLDRLRAAGLLEEGVLLAANASSAPSKSLLKDAIQNGDEISGACIREGSQRLVVR